MNGRWTRVQFPAAPQGGICTTDLRLCAKPAIDFGSKKIPSRDHLEGIFRIYTQVYPQVIHRLYMEILGIEPRSARLFPTRERPIATPVRGSYLLASAAGPTSGGAFGFLRYVARVLRRFLRSGRIVAVRAYARCALARKLSMSRMLVPESRNAVYSHCMV